MKLIVVRPREYENGAPQHYARDVRRFQTSVSLGGGLAGEDQ